MHLARAGRRRSTWRVCGALRTACAVLGGIVVGCTPAATTPRDGTVLSTAVFEAGASRIQRGARPALPRPPTLEDGLDDPVPPVSIREGEAATWPKIEMIRNCTRISRTLDGILERLEARSLASLDTEAQPLGPEAQPLDPEAADASARPLDEPAAPVPLSRAVNQG